jgi:hypothetical protein
MAKKQQQQQQQQQMDRSLLSVRFGNHATGSFYITVARRARIY